MKNYRTKDQINKKLCIDCELCVPTGGCLTSRGFECGAFRSLVDDSPLHSAEHSRGFKCKGHKWVIDPNIEICKDQAEADEKYKESNIEKYMKQAREFVKSGREPRRLTNGYLEMAMERARREKEAQKLELIKT